METSQTRVFPARFDVLAAVSEFVVQAAASAGLDESAAYAVQMAVDEAFTNIVEHAYGGEDRGDVECTCRAGPEGLTVILRDFGQAFCPECVPEPNLSACIEERQPGGLGLYFIRQLMDEVHFEFTSDSGNVLTMVKLKSP
ncbi:MAG: ATP-binding protein [Anaerolineae bacterium]|nr:ATP-binding protein [Anaerolineae bacterium]